MSSTIEKNKLKNPNQQSSNSGSTIPKPTATTRATQTLKNVQEKNNTREEEEGAKGTKKRRPTKVGLNDTLRRIRHLMIEGRSILRFKISFSLKSAPFTDTWPKSTK